MWRQRISIFLYSFSNMEKSRVCSWQKYISQKPSQGTTLEKIMLMNHQPHGEACDLRSFPLREWYWTLLPNPKPREMGSDKISNHPDYLDSYILIRVGQDSDLCFPPVSWLQNGIWRRSSQGHLKWVSWI